MMRTLALALGFSCTVLADTVVLRDRTVLTGEVTRTDGALAVQDRTFPIDEVMLWEDDQGVIRLDTPLAEQLEAYRILADRAGLETCRERLAQAVEAGAGKAAARLLARAEHLGLDPKQAEVWEAKLEGLEGGGEFAVPGNEVRAALLVARARANGASDWNERGLALLRAAFRVDEENAEAKKLLEAVAPSRWTIGDARVWLDWSVDVLPGGVRVLKRRHPDMERARVTWERDIHGVETDEIVFITKMERSAPVAMCLKYSQLTCKALDEMFRTDDPQRSESLPLVIYFYGSKEEYVENMSGGSPEAAKFLGLTLGFYTPGENISRFFWPQLPDPEGSVRDTFVHELTHHWIQRRNPRWHARDTDVSGGSVQVPGYWIVEGFAVFIQEGRYDIRSGAWSHFNPHARSIDVTAALAEKGGLIAWDKVFPLTQEEFHTQLDKEKAHAHFKTKWAIMQQGIMEIRLFYEQSGAACHFLYWGEKGRYREQLLDYVTSFYTSSADKTSTETAFGLTPKELGAKVESWCKEVMAGWRP